MTIVSGPWQHSLQLPYDRSAAAQARDAVRFHARDVLAHDVYEDTLLLVSELVSNAVLHGAPDIELTLLLQPPAITVRVSNGPSQLDTDAETTPDRPPRGRGLLILASIARRWGATTGAAGTAVWFELDPTSSPS